MPRTIVTVMSHTTTSQRVPPTLTVYETARVMQVVPATVYTWVRDGDLPSVKLGGRVRIPTAKLADLLGMTSEELVATL